MSRHSAIEHLPFFSRYGMMNVILWKKGGSTSSLIRWCYPQIAFRHCAQTLIALPLFRDRSSDSHGSSDME